ncbi:MAG: NACHT domain-containing protein [Burkholderiales bacterium]|nr:NACHT domain-containing protein [Burkholderiales bacterium]
MSTPPIRPTVATARWRVRVLGGMRADDGQETIERFGSGSVASLLARLAMYPSRRHSREELVELLWPGVQPEAGRNRLRQTLFALRALLEPPSAMPRPVIVADRTSIAAVDGALDCDAVEFERAMREGRHADALALYRGELLPGHYDEWIDEERMRLTALAERAEAALSRAGAAPTPPAAPLASSPPAVARRERSPLPLYLTRFFGREADVARLREALVGDRLVTLLGPGGGGKTRLATEVAAAWRAAAPRGELTLFVALVGSATREALLDALAAALHLPPADSAPLERVVDALEARPALLVLDNFEQLVEVGADVVARLLSALPELRILITSRRALGLDGERQLLLPPLGVPAPSATLAEAAASPAVSLFVDRARAARADFHLSERNRPVLIELAQALEGLPLALELAASRVRSVSPAEMLEHLRPAAGAPAGAGLALLARPGPRGGGDPRHASMLRTIEWSWRLLPPPLQRLLAELTVFEGGFSLAAASAVGSAGAQPVVLMLDELVGHSLLAAQRSEGEDQAGAATRFALDESIRAFAAATLAAPEAAAVRARHRRWLADWGRALPATPPLAALRAELRNLGAALHSALADAAAEEGVAAMVALRRGLPDTALPASLLPVFEAALAGTADPALASRGHTLLGRLLLGAGGAAAARDHADRGLRLARALPAATPERDELLARALQTAASVAWRTLRDAGAAEALLDESEPLAARSGDLGAQASADALRAFIANIAHRDLARAEALHAQAMRRWEQAGDALSANNGRYNLAVCALRGRRFDEVLLRLGEVAREAERQHDWRLLSQARNVAGEAETGRRDWAAAAAAYRDSLELAWSALARPSFAYALWNLPYPLARLRRPEQAARLAGAAEAYWQAHIGGLDAGDRRDLRRLRRLVGAQLGAARTERLWHEGAALAVPEVVALALTATAEATA